jgi:hypothetical protein
MQRTLAIVLAVLSIYTVVYAGPTKLDPNDAFSRIEANQKLVKDYKADVSMSIKGPQISVNRMPMTIYYKQPNKFKLDAKEGMAFAPQGVFTGNPAARFAGGPKPVYLKTEKLRGMDCWVYKAGDAEHPGAEAMIWIDLKRVVVVAIEVKGQISLKSEWDYIKISNIYLPTKIKAEIQTSIMPGGPQHHRDPGIPAKSTAVVEISNYKLNKGLPDSLFVEKEKDKQQARPHWRRKN